MTSIEVQEVVSAVLRCASAITPNIRGSNDETGSHVESLTEAVMGMTAGLCQIANAIENLADAMREVHNDD